MTAEHDQLPCGVELDALVVHVAEDEPLVDPAHHGSCPYCQTALRSLHQGWQDFQALTRDHVPVPAGLTARIMARVRVLAGHVSDSILIGHPRGETAISHRVVGQTIQRVASAVPGVVFASAKSIPHDPPEPGRLRVALRLVVAFGPAIETIGQSVRHRIDRRIPRLTGAELSRIDITVEDITELPD